MTRKRWFEDNFDAFGANGLTERIRQLRRDADEADAYLKQKQAPVTITLPSAFAARLLAVLAPVHDHPEMTLTAVESNVAATLKELITLLKSAGVR